MAGDLRRVDFYVSVPVQLGHLSLLIPYRVGGVTGCSEGCAVYTVFDVFVVRDGVVAHYQDSCVPLGNLVWTGGTEVTWITERSREDQRGSEGLALLGCPALEARG